MNKAKMVSILIISVSLLVLDLGWSTIDAGDFYIVYGGNGDATVDDVLVGKIFSNSNATGLEGERPPATVEWSGQTTSYQLGDDGYHQKGASWPEPRFSAGTNVVTDNLTGLMWQRSLNPDLINWASAVTYCRELVLQGTRTDYQDLRLPNVRELLSLIDHDRRDPALPSGHPFVGVEISDEYWTSTYIAPDYPSHHRNWTVLFDRGILENSHQDLYQYVWCVRDGYGGVAN